MSAQFKYKPLSVAYHEIGHAIVQALFDLGPDSLTIREENGGWYGHAKMFKSAETAPQELLDLMAMAGPIAQLVFDESSLGDYAAMLRPSILDRHTELLGKEMDCRILLEIHWGGDLQRDTSILLRSKMVGGSVRKLHPSGYLFDEEAALRNFFNTREVTEFARERAQRLAEQGELDAPSFIAEAKAAVPREAAELLLASTAAPDFGFPKTK